MSLDFPGSFFFAELGIYIFMQKTEQGAPLLFFTDQLILIPTCYLAEKRVPNR